jgi:hypothetical protein
MLEYELKFVVPNHHLAPIMEFVNLSCRADSIHPAGIVSSIYFDSLQWDSLNEKINSDYIKTKFRLRWYRDPDSGSYSEASFAESKHRIGCRRVKARVTTDIAPERLDRISLDDASLLDVPVRMRRNGIPTASNLFPSLLIRYTRHRYIEPATGARVSIDSGITAPRINRHMLPRGTGNGSALSHAVIEVKSPRDTLPRSLRPLVIYGIRKASFSKYLACYAKCLQTEFVPL